VRGVGRAVTVPAAEGVKPGPARERAFAEFLEEAMDSYACECEIEQPDIRSFARAGITSNNTGLVVRFAAHEYEITIVRVE
jgi:hypothetical protein